FLDSEYKTSISYNLQEVIYINQGDIVNYFEKNSLKDLIKESGKNEEYKVALEDFKTRKKELSDSIEKLLELYSELCDTLNSNFTLHNRDIESIFDTSYYFKSVNQVEDKTLSFSKSTNIVEELLKNIEEFKINENWDLTEEELELTEKFKSLVESK